MSYAIDVNILLYASDQGSPVHQRACRFLEECVTRQETLCICWPTLMSYLRISTHPRIFSRPLSPQKAKANAEALLQLPQTRVLSEGEDFWSCYCRVTESLIVRGNLVPDAHLTALLMEHDVRVLYTNDADFKKFDLLEVRNPLTS